MKKEGINISDLTMQLRSKMIILVQGKEDLSHISNPTVTQAIKMYSEYYKKFDKKDNYVFKLKPYKNLKLGNVQVDVKYLTPSFSSLKQTIY
jgi:hypothetical protein